MERYPWSAINNVKFDSGTHWGARVVNIFTKQAIKGGPCR